MRCITLLYDNEGLTDALFRTFLVYIASSGRPPHELLNPSLKAIDREFAAEFDGMTTTKVLIEELLDARSMLAGDILARLDQNAMRFLLTLDDGAPDFDAIGPPWTAELPAICWKLMNLARLKELNPGKHAEQRSAIEQLV